MKKYKIQISSKFKKQLKKLNDIDKMLMNYVVDILSNGEILEAKYKDHQLGNNLKEYRECHIKPDLLMIYRYIDDKLLLYLYKIGSHSDLFK